MIPSCSWCSLIFYSPLGTGLSHPRRVLPSVHQIDLFDGHADENHCGEHGFHDTENEDEKKDEYQDVLSEVGEDQGDEGLTNVLLP